MSPPVFALTEPTLAYGFRYMQGANSQFDTITQVERQAADITNRNQLTAWVRGSLRTLIPHQKAILGFGQAGYSAPRFDRVHMVDLPDDYFAAIDSHNRHSISPVLEYWLQRRVPQTFLSQVFERSTYDRWYNNLKHHQIDNGIFDANVECVAGRMCFIKLFNISMPLENAANILTQFVIPLLAKIWTQIDAHDLHANAIQLRPLVRTGPPLSAAEREIIPWLRERKTNSEIGQILGKSELTIKTQIQQMLKKTGLQNRHALAANADSLR